MTREQELMEMADRLCGGTGRAFRICEAMRVKIEREAPRGSTLNDDGSPLELCVTAGPERCSCRIVGDPEAEETDWRRRFAAFTGALGELLPLCGATGLAAAMSRAITAWLPTDEHELARLTRGILWLGAGIDLPGVGIYLDGRVGSIPSSWQRAKQWLGEVLPDPEPARRFTLAFEEAGGLGGVGLEGITPELARVKIQWGLTRAIRLDELGLPLIGSDPLREFLSLVFRDRAFLARCPVFSAGFKLTTGELTDVKVDLCGAPCCLNLSAEEWAGAIAEVCGKFGLVVPPVLEALRAGRCRGVYLGFGVDARGMSRMDLFLQGPAPAC